MDRGEHLKKLADRAHVNEALERLGALSGHKDAHPVRPWKFLNLTKDGKACMQLVTFSGSPFDLVPRSERQINGHEIREVPLLEVFKALRESARSAHPVPSGYVEAAAAFASQPRRERGPQNS